MSSQSSESKSTKRRRYLNDMETIDFIVENQEQLNFLPQPSTSIDNDNDLVVESHDKPSLSVIVNDGIFSNNINTDDIFNFSFSNINFDDNNVDISDYYDLQNESCSSDSNDEYSTNSNNILYDNQCLILKLIANWTIEHNITLSALSALLKLLKNHKCFSHFPVDARTVLKTPNKPNEIQTIQSGYYYHFGIANGLKSHCNFSIINENIIKLVVGIDGLPLTKSSSSAFWPILAYARYSSFKSNVFLVGLYWGKEKPQCSNSFLKNLVDELKFLAENGMDTAYGRKNVKVETFCCDTPAKSFILNTKGHVGYYSCPRCIVEGERINNTMCFLGTNFRKRTHLDFINRVDDEHHIGNTISILTEIPYINMVDDFSIDYMHLVCLGIVKKLILLWLGIFKKSPVNVRIQSQNVHVITNCLLFNKKYVTVDFSRKPRGLNDIVRWKATEFRQFLLYTGPIVLKGILLDECYIHFMCLHVAFRILLCPVSTEKLVNFSEKLLIHFVEKFEEIYGPQFSSHNIHGLIHIVDDYRKFGSLEECSCFPFENYMKFLKKMVRKHERPLEQVIKRYQEFLTFSESKLNNNLHNEIIYKKKTC